MVDNRPNPRRIEIELDPNRGDPSDAMLADGEAVIGRPVERESGTEGAGQRRLFLIAAIVGVLAMVLGWLVGRSGLPDEVATIDAGSPATTEVVESTLLPGETLPSAATTTTRPRRTTTTSTLAPLIRERVELDPRLAGIELALVGLDRNDLVELDLAAETLTRFDLGRSNIEPPDFFVVGGDWVAIGSHYGGNWRVIDDDGSIRQHDLGEPWEVIWQVGTDNFWRPVLEDDVWDDPTLFEEIDLAGQPTGTTLELPTEAWPQGADPRGGLLVERTGKLYSVDESSIELIGAGDLIALSSELAVRRDCDDQLRCGLFVTDRRTGEVSGLPGDESGGPRRIEGLSNWGWGGWQSGGSVSPDGSVCAVIVLDEDDVTLGLLDLRSGEVTEVGEGLWVPSVVWSPDDRFVFFLDGSDGFGSYEGGNLNAYDRRSGETFPVLSEPPDRSEPLEWVVLSARS